MEYYIFVFWSRTDGLAFANTLKKYEIPAQMVPTPREAGRTCGLSVKILPEYYPVANNVLQRGRYSSFGGILKYYLGDGRWVIMKGK